MARQSKPKRDIPQEVTDRVIAALENGVGPWVSPHNAQAGFPVNARTSKRYNGINVFLLWLTAQDKGYKANRWTTYKQATDAKTHVLRGEKSTLVIFWKFLKKIDEKTGKVNSFPMVRHYNVFNVEQTCDGCGDTIKAGKGKNATTFTCNGPSEKFLGINPDVEPLSDADRIERADQVLDTIKANMGIKVTAGGARACYIPSLDEIQHPVYGDFKSAEGFCSTLFHELGHGTGHSKRLDRDMANRFGSEAYAREELVAEMTSAFMCATLEIQNNLQHPEYIANWIKVLKGDKRAIITAQSQAKKAHAFLLDAAGISEEEEEGAE